MKYNGFYFWMFKGSMKQVPAEKYNNVDAAISTVYGHAYKWVY